MISPPAQHIRTAVQAALDEDLSLGDMTTASLFPDPILGRGTIIAHEAIIVAGVAVARLVFTELDESLQILPALHDGQRAQPNDTILTIEGDARSILMGERVALNFLQHLSGIATLTNQLCHAVKDYPTKIFDTRKTIPGLRAMEKWAVRLGGGHNHRQSLGEGVLIKDNHLLLLQSQGITIATACRSARERVPPHTQIIVEVQSLEEVQQALEGRADVIMLDNMTAELVRTASVLISDKAIVEVSGGINQNNISEMAAAGAQTISIGALTHSAPAANLSLDLVPLEPMS